MQFALVPLLGREVKAVGFERGDAFSHLDWSKPDRWRLDFTKIEREFRAAILEEARGKLPSALVLQLQVYDFKVWGDVFGRIGFGSDYSRPKRQLTLSVRLDYSKIKGLDSASQFSKLRSALSSAASSGVTTLQTPITVSLPDVCAVIRAAAARVQTQQVEAAPSEA